MSSTQFNKGPSYGLSAEVKNRVSGRGARQPRTHDPCRSRASLALLYPD